MLAVLLQLVSASFLGAFAMEYYPHDSLFDGDCGVGGDDQPIGPMEVIARAGDAARQAGLGPVAAYMNPSQLCM